MTQPAPDAEPPTAAQLADLLAHATLLVDAAQIERQIIHLAAELDSRLRGTVPLLLCIMNGGLMFTGRLMANMQTFSELDFVQTSRYRKGTTGGSLDWRVEPERPLRGRDLVLIDDIFDEGHTLAAIHQYCLDRGARRVLSVVLLDKQHDRKIFGYRPDLIGQTVPDRFLVGFGMDWAGYFRHLPAVYAIRLAGS